MENLFVAFRAVTALTFGLILFLVNGTSVAVLGGVSWLRS